MPSRRTDLDHVGTYNLNTKMVKKAASKKVQQQNTVNQQTQVKQTSIFDNKTEPKA